MIRLDSGASSQNLGMFMSHSVARPGAESITCEKNRDIAGGLPDRVRAVSVATL